MTSFNLVINTPPSKYHVYDIIVDMKIQLINIAKSVPIILLATIIVAGVVYAGSFTPPPSPISAQSYTLGDLYNKVSNINYSATLHTVSTTSSPQSSFHTLTDIYNKLTTEGGHVTPGNIRSGVTMFGVMGTYTGTSGGGGAITWAPPSSFVLSACYSNTLIGHLPGSICDTNNIFSYSRLSGWGAVEYCAHLNENGLSTSTAVVGIWRLPTAAEMFNSLDFLGGLDRSVISGLWSSSPAGLLSGQLTQYVWRTDSNSVFQLGISGRNSAICVK